LRAAAAFSALSRTRAIAYHRSHFVPSHIQSRTLSYALSRASENQRVSIDTAVSSDKRSRVCVGGPGLRGFHVDASSRRELVLHTVKEQTHAHKDAFYVVDLCEPARKYTQWRAELPRVRPFYAVKCNDDVRVVETLAQTGTGFDCASKGEMSMVLKLGVDPKDIIFAHPAKQVSHIHYAKEKGVKKMTFDNEDELRKIVKEYPEAELVLRILTDDSHSVCRLGLKFGCPLESVPSVLATAKSLGANVIGISYHVGSGNGHAQSFGDAVRDAKKAFNIAESLGMKFTLLDIGGGFPGSELGAEGESDSLRHSTDSSNPYAKHPSFSKIAAHVRTALDECFPEGCGVDIIAEPGRYFVKSSHALAVNVIGKRKTEDEATKGTRINYYVNDGLYGSFNCVMYDHITCAPALVLKNSAVDAAEADDAIAKIDAEGRPIATDELGVAYAADMAVATTHTVAQEQVNVRSLVVNGEVDSVSAGSFAYAAAAVAAARSLPGSSSVTYTYGSLSGVDVPESLKARESAPVVKAYPTSIWGPTCDSIDKISDSLVMPELAIGDWLVFENMGAYTIAGSCKFNGFPLSTKVYLHRDGSIEVQNEETHD
jgi:ornithine decarboxylase